MRVGAIDIGTNTVLLLVAERRNGVTVAVREEATITRLGQGVDRTRALAPEAIARTSACLERYAAIARELGVEATDVVGTSAMRDARGADEVRGKVRELFGVDARVISGDEEARLTFAGALSALTIDRAEEGVVVFDIGGGSTEIVRGAGGEITYAKSFNVGSVRLTERHVKSDPPTLEEIDAAKRDAKTAFAELPALPTGSPPVGIAGTMTTLGAVSLGMTEYDGARVHGHRMTRAALAKVVEDLASKPLEARRAVAGLEPKRADVIVAGGLIALAAIDQLGAHEVLLSDRGVRWGLAERLLVGR